MEQRCKRILFSFFLGLMSLAALTAGAQQASQPKPQSLI